MSADQDISLFEPNQVKTATSKPGKMISKTALKPLLVSAVNYGKKYKEFIKEIESPNFILKETSEGMKKGWKIIEEMKRDAQVGSDLRTLKGKIKGLKWTIQVDSEVEEDNTQADALKKLYEPVHRDLVTECLEAVEYGFAIVEKNWAINEEGLVYLPSVKGHEHADWTFDENGTPGLKTKENPEPAAVEMERIMHVTFDAPRGNPWGRSAFIEAFWAWYWKKHALLFWAIYCEKFGQPTIVGYHEKSAEDEEINRLLETLESIQSDTAVTLEKGWEIEFKEATRSGKDSYEALILYLDRQITKAILSTAMSTNENRYGTYNQGLAQNNITDEVLEQYALRLQDIINRDVVSFLAGWNFNFTVMPQLYIHYDAKNIAKEEAESDKVQSELMPIPLEDLYQKYGWNKPDGDEPVIFNGNITTWAALMKGQGQGQVKESPTFSKFAVVTRVGTDGTDGTDEPNKELSDSALFLLKEGDFLDRVFIANKSRFDAAVDFERIEQAFDVEDFAAALPGLDNAELSNSLPVWEEFQELAACLAEYSVLHQVGRIQPTNGSFSKSGRFDLGDPLSGLSLLDMDYGIEAFKNITPKEAVKWFKNKLPVNKEIWDALRKELKNNAFFLKRIDDYELVVRIKEEMLKSLDEGLTFQDFKKSLRDVLDVKKLNAYLRTSFNTNMFSALSVENERALLRNTDMFPYWRYSALLDRHTCKLCRALHNFTARWDHPAWSSITPPNHHNCKCRKVIASPAEVQQYLGVIKWDVANPPFRPMEGFDFNPAVSLERVFKRVLLEKGAKSLKLNSEIRAKVV